MSKEKTQAQLDDETIERALMEEHEFQDLYVSFESKDEGSDILMKVENILCYILGFKGHRAPDSRNWGIGGLLLPASEKSSILNYKKTLIAETCKKCIRGQHTSKAGVPLTRPDFSSLKKSKRKYLTNQFNEVSTSAYSKCGDCRVAKVKGMATKMLNIAVL